MNKSTTLSIGDFSRATALTVKTLRHYHERKLLIPSFVDPDSGYRYYDLASIERARVIQSLRALDLSLDQIAEILEQCEDDADTIQFLVQHREAIVHRLGRLKEINHALSRVIEAEKEAEQRMSDTTQIIEKQLPPLLIAGIRMQGPFTECANGFKQLGRALGLNIAGKPGMLIYDEEYKDEDANFEVFFPVKKKKSGNAEIVFRELEGGTGLTMIHKGPYSRISAVYAQLFAEIRRRGHQANVPSREIYIKGPGMIFKGNPERYLTEVQILVE